MTRYGGTWNEATLSEYPAVEHLKRLGYTYRAAEALDSERVSAKEVVLPGRLANAIKRLNPWISDDNIFKAMRAITGVQAASALEASEKLHTTLTYGIALEQDVGGGKKGQSVRFFDFDVPTNNEFIVTRQFRVQGAKKHIVPDIVLLVNGIPLVVIECKSPTLGETWKVEALDQFSRYQELETRYRELGAPKLFEPVQILVATCGQSAFYGTVTTPHRHYAEWKTLWPTTEAATIKSHGRAPSAQEMLFEGMLAPANLLDIVRNFVVFERDTATGRTLRKLCRYQQFAAVNKAIARARKAKTPGERGGVVWHTQGSGKSLTMLWLALKLRRDPSTTTRRSSSSPTARTSTNRSSRPSGRAGSPTPSGPRASATCARCSPAPPARRSSPPCTSSRSCRRRATGPGASAKEEFPSSRPPRTCSSSPTRPTAPSTAASPPTSARPCRTPPSSASPARRSTRRTAARSRPSAATSTPTPSSRRRDGATVPIFYEGRLAELRIIGNNLDAVFDRVFADRSREEREAIKKKYAREAAIAGAPPKRIETIALDLLEHYTKHPAQRLQGADRRLLARGRLPVQGDARPLNAPQSAVIISARTTTTRCSPPPHQRGAAQGLIAPLHREGRPLSILIVCDMLITGFDAPVEQVMYLDAPLKEHTLLQAIARVNRTADGKTYGLIVDYWGVSEASQEALEIFAPSDVKGALQPKGDELPRLQTRHAAVMRTSCG
jgi:type I restriction enzyme R subunit